jgi:peptidoglycan hydrolase CwlO-like protein
LAAFGKLQGQINALRQGISDVSVIVAENDAPYATASKDENGIITIDLSVGTLADASNGATGLASIEDIYQVLTEDELVWAAALNALNTSINIVNTSVANHETRITSLEASIGSLGPDLTQRVENLEASVGDISTWVSETKTWIVNTDSSIADINSSIANIKTDITDINSSIDNIKTDIADINSSITNIKTDITDINASIQNVSSRVSELENASYVNTIGASGDQWVKAGVDNTTGDVTVSVGIADGVMVDSNNITGTMVDTSILTAKAVQDMINNTVTGAVDFLGVFGTAGQDINAVLVDVQASTKGAKTEYGDFFKFGNDVSAGGVEHAYHAGDVFVYNLDTHTAAQIKDPANWTLVHGEPDTDTWRAVKVNGTQVLSGTVNGGVALDISAGDAIQVTGDGTTGAVVINVVDSSTAPWHDATNDWALL